ncbi:acetyl-CoA carboxylase biotin carboxyl carrier protein subunit [Bacillus sp. FJAT-42376]|uniref:acetyl-CoA carboxylase biotin carboxyl carrier protein subunit n=1 Tax=Bacillus sp. FJAT-42376 TaxID=2014076 RepID=UPI000F4E968E|nr:acetyl-CoA carboxylase biotin carboxyl carrier protein subunit [Bacillus sp. FJAT-42376]AZB42828.1 acetyl-CoA carboxylase biotin carboxyl carrier protein subunit [Bacillus sp. FJAT-42376]
MKEITASMAGTVLNVLVDPGSSVASGQDLLMLESMKMEIPIESSHSGTVKEIKVQLGDFVNEGDVLVILED